MLRFILFLLALLPHLTIAAAGPSVPPLDNLGQPFYSKTIQVEWKLKTNTLPATVRTFETIPGNFSQSVVSNVMQLGGFTMTNRINKNASGDALSSQVISFRSADERSWLVFAPSQINLTLQDFSTSWPTNVPDRQRAIELGTNLLRLLEIQTAELMSGTNGKPKAWFYPGTRSGYDRKKGEYVRNAPNVMGVEFRRQLDHIPCAEDRIHMRFESEEKLTKLEVHWHSVKPSPAYNVASTAQITSWIKEGRARVSSVETTGGRELEPADIRKITIHDIDLNYTGATYLLQDSYEEKPATHMYPYAVLTAEAELKPGDTEIIYICVPMISEALTQAICKSDSFGIYPSRLYEKQAAAEKETQ